MLKCVTIVAWLAALIVPTATAHAQTARREYGCSVHKMGDANVTECKGTIKALRALTDVVPVLPPAPPQGFQLKSVDVQIQPRRNPDCPRDCEDYTVTYAGGRATIEFAGANWSAGGGPPLNGYRSYFSSTIFGRGFVTQDNESPCLIAQQLNDRYGPQFLMNVPGSRVGRPSSAMYNYSVKACDSNLRPSDLAKLVQSAGIFKP